MVAFYCFGIILFIPLIVGLHILRQPYRNDMTRMAGILTLKPVVLTPIWWLIGSNGGTAASAIAPAIIVTLLIMIYFRSLLFGSKVRGAAWLLIGLDCVRWSSSFALLVVPLPTDPSDTLIFFSSILMPSIFAAVALGIAVREQRMLSQRKPVDKKKRMAS